ncbi:GNAT family N-acetyltransferase [Microaerobacter geothermalis]|uniref:GNAT family N-acetyltransferase n=1 Tax=Microaerobacter geothermalis TaxID=674972 RepID=UPI001F31ADBD|nr:GNAT family N-acetyltransferase [Microaerobacter geothermalis]MCF6094933.1 GNAT family N-acetyltransferase [Microaerobacter geothermalis]
MIFETDNFMISTVEEKDIEDVLEIYNSNTEFLQKHMDRSEITIEWLKEELEEMKRAGFNSYKMIEKSAGKTFGILDIKIAEESYLSLLMIHNDYKDKGYGKEIYTKIEDYIKTSTSKSIRIDVVTDYNRKVENFWERNGFKKVGYVELNWTGKRLPAVTMRKKIRNLHTEHIFPYNKHIHHKS